MGLLTLLTKFAENAHHKVSVSEMIENQSAAIKEAFMTNNNAQLRNILSGGDVNYADRDRVVTIEQ